MVRKITTRKVNKKGVHLAACVFVGLALSKNNLRVSFFSLGFIFVFSYLRNINFSESLIRIFKNSNMYIWFMAGSPLWKTEASKMGPLIRQNREQNKCHRSHVWKNRREI